VLKRLPKAIPKLLLAIVANTILDQVLFILYTRVPSYLIPKGPECLHYATVTCESLRTISSMKANETLHTES